MRPGLDKRLEFAAGVAPATHRDDAVFRSGGNQLIADVGIRLEITFVAPHDATDVFLVLVRSEGEAYVGVSIISVLSVQVGIAGPAAFGTKQRTGGHRPGRRGDRREPDAGGFDSGATDPTMLRGSGVNTRKNAYSFCGRPTNCHLGIHARSEAVLLWAKNGFKDRANHQQQRHLRHAVRDRGDAEWTLAAIALGYPHAKKGLRAIGLAPQLLLQLRRPRSYALGLDLLERDPVHTRCPAVGTAVLVCLPEHVLSADLVPETVETIARLGLCFRLQRLLQLLNRLKQSW